MASSRTDQVGKNVKKADRLLELDPKEFTARLESAFDARLGSVELINERRAFPLKGQVASRFTADRAALIGDAAHVVHPLAGQGVNLGLQDAVSLADKALSWIESSGDPGDSRLLRSYERERRSETLLMVKSLELLLELFQINQGPVRQLRGAGLNLVDNIVPLKNMLARRALRGTVNPQLRGN